LAWIYRRRGQIEAARADLLLAISAFSSHSALRGEAWAYYMLADLEIERDVRVALSLAQKSVYIFGQAGDRRGRGWALRLCGDISRQSGLNPEAIAAYSRAAEILQELGDRRGSARALGGMAGVYARTGQFSKAADFYEECSILFRELGDDRWELRVLRELHEIYASMGKRRRVRACIARENAIAGRVGPVSLEPALRL
jgi:tetratricopeptide (TPR) repeat protein